MALAFNKEDMRAQFHQLGAEREKIREASAPLRAQRDALREQQAALREQIKAIDAQVREIEMPMFEIDNDRAMIARVLGRRTGTPENH